MRRFTVVLCFLFLVSCTASALAATSWRTDRLEIGVQSPEWQAKQARASIPKAHYRYQYISGGVNTASTWQQWGSGDGAFVSDYIKDSVDNKFVPVFTYYQIRQSLPGANNSDEPEAVLSNLKDPQLMKTYYEDLKRFMIKSQSSKPVVLHFEPDAFGYGQKASRNNDASTVPVSVASSGMPDLQGMPNTMAGFAQSVLVLRNNYAPNVKVAYPVSIWGTNKDITHSDEHLDDVKRLANISADFYRSLRANYNMTFGEFADRDYGYAETLNGNYNARWDAEDFKRHTAFFAQYHKRVPKPIVLWQIPLGNTVYKTMDNTPNHYQDNRVQWLFGDKNRLRAYRDAGVVALLFGAGQSTSTHFGDVARDGITNRGSGKTSKSTEDDGGYFREQANKYYKGPLKSK